MEGLEFALQPLSVISGSIIRLRRGGLDGVRNFLKRHYSCKFANRIHSSAVDRDVEEPHATRLLWQTLHSRCPQSPPARDHRGCPAPEMAWDTAYGVRRPGATSLRLSVKLDVRHLSAGLTFCIRRRDHTRCGYSINERSAAFWVTESEP